MRISDWSSDGCAADLVAVLIEALNSTAIDVSKILSNEVADSSWAAYLKGDRGVFTRRAVKLLDAGEAREIAHHYDQDLEFREHVNRYIHDFEAMLRHILATRDGRQTLAGSVSGSVQTGEKRREIGRASGRERVCQNV